MADASPRTDISTDADTEDKSQRVLTYYLLNFAMLEICLMVLISKDSGLHNFVVLNSNVQFLSHIMAWACGILPPTCQKSIAVIKLLQSNTYALYMSSLIEVNP